MIHKVWRALLQRDGAGLTDGQLVERFRAQRDESAFAALLRRHGPMVWGVCRRILPSHQDAEDAFQAVFLVLVRKAASIHPPDKVAAWLHGVACRAALKARSLSYKRRVREVPLGTLPMELPARPQQSDELRTALDREIAGLPDKFRIAVILCDLEGRTRRDAAGLLGVPQGTLSARLDRARRMLTRRLTQRGLGLTGLWLATTLAREAAVPATVLAATSKAVALFTTGQATAAGMFPGPVAALAKEVMTNMLLTKLKSVVAVVLLAGAFTTSLAGLGYLAQASDPAEAATGSDGQVAPAEPSPLGDGAGKKPQPSGKIDWLEAKLTAAERQLAELFYAQKVKQAQFEVELQQMQNKLKAAQLQLQQALSDKEVLHAQLEQVKAKLDKLQQAKGEQGKLTVKVYAVADLVTPAGPVGGAPGKAESNGAALIQVITKTIEPASWQGSGFGPAMPGGGMPGGSPMGAGQGAGGNGTIEYFPLGKGLVINQTPDIHARIQLLLDDLRKVKKDQEKGTGAGAGI